VDALERRLQRLESRVADVERTLASAPQVLPKQFPDLALRQVTLTPSLSGIISLTLLLILES
jgi:uncharacterized coiled-coil protein SlyX